MENGRNRLGKHRIIPKHIESLIDISDLELTEVPIHMGECDQSATEGQLANGVTNTEKMAMEVLEHVI